MRPRVSEKLDVCITPVSLVFWQVIAFPDPHRSTRPNLRKRESLLLFDHFENILFRVAEMHKNWQVKKKKEILFKGAKSNTTIQKK